MRISCRSLRDAQTGALLIIGEIGGHDEEDFAAALMAQRFQKPVFALIAGRTAPEGIAMGHAGALIYGGHGTYDAKRAALAAAGAGLCVARRNGEGCQSAAVAMQARRR